MSNLSRHRSRTSGLVTLVAALLVLCSFSAAATADPTGVTGPTAGVSAQKKSSKAAALPSFSVGAEGSYKYRGRRYVLPRARVEFKGSVKGNLDGQIVKVVIKKGNHTVATDNVRLTARGGKSSFSSAFRVGKKGKYVARVELTPAQEALASAGSGVSVKVVRTNIHRGSRGVTVRLFQNKLKALKYVVPINGKFDAATGRAFIAFRKTNSMKRNESAGYRVARKLAEGKGGFKLKYPGAGRHVEVSIKKQVMAFADNGKVVRIYHVSTGAPGTPTVRGTYHVYRKDPGTNAKGMVKSSYFIRGYAIHGYASVPNYNASHGCVRVPVPNAASIFAWVHMGTRIDTYY